MVIMVVLAAFTEPGRERHVLEGHWEQLESEKNWQPWMDVRLTRQQSGDPRTAG
ncbi:MAG TPA: hypothetical protein VKP64_02670 [Mycobacteriales bacterium]|nr:hypothetical protein [Mycobacteriales bacterium]